MWPNMVEFRSASSACIPDEKRKKEESLVKCKSADNYVGRPKHRSHMHITSYYYHNLAICLRH